MWDNATALTPETQHGRITEVTVRHQGVEKRITCRFVIVADGVALPVWQKTGPHLAQRGRVRYCGPLLLHHPVVS